MFYSIIFQPQAPISGKLLPAASYRRPPFEPINLADADFGIEPDTSSTKFNLLHNGFVESIKPEEITPLLDIGFPSNEKKVDSILDIIDEYQYKPFNSNVPPDHYNGQETLKDFRPDLLESYDSAKESDKNHSIDNVQRLPDVTSCPVLITSPDSSKDDCTISSELQSLNTSEIYDIDSTNADYSDGELYKCLQEYEEREDLLSINNNGNSSADIITPHSEFSDELIAEKPLICDDSVSEIKDTLSSETSDDLQSNKDFDEPQENNKEPSLLTEEEKLILEEILEDSINLDVDFEENKTDEQLEKELENILGVTVECEVTRDQIQNKLDDHNNITELPIASLLSVKLESHYNEPIQTIKQQTEETNTQKEVPVEEVEDNTFFSEPQVKCVKEPTDSLCSIESTDTILLKEDNQTSVNTVTDSLDSQSTCSLPSEVIGDIVNNSDENRIQRPSTLDLNGATNCETQLASTLSTGKLDNLYYIVKSN